MILYIVRHGLAGQHGDPRYPDDSLRPLTDKGRKQFRRAIKKLAKRGIAPALVATSPYLRCRQTADELRERIAGPPRLEPRDELQPGSRLEPLIAWSNAQGVDELAWVGHAPDVDEMTAVLIGGGDGISFAKGAVAAIRFHDAIAPGGGELEWFVTPHVLGCE